MVQVATQANYESVVYLLDLFEGRLSLTDVLAQPIAALMEMKNAKEKELTARSQELKKSTRALGKPPAPLPINLGSPNSLPDLMPQ